MQTKMINRTVRTTTVRLYYKVNSEIKVKLFECAGFYESEKSDILKFRCKEHLKYLGLGGDNYVKYQIVGYKTKVMCMDEQKFLEESEIKKEIIY